MPLGHYQQYTDLKGSGIEGLGGIPRHWGLLKIGRAYRRLKRSGFPELELLSVYRDYGVVKKSSRDDNNNKPSEDLSPYQKVEKQDLVMNKMKAWQGSIAVSDLEGIVSPAYFVYRPEDKFSKVSHPRFIHYLLRNPLYVSQYLSRSKGIRVNQWDLDPDEFEKIEMLLPPLPEQQKIAQFLDHETARIDTLIEKQQQLIALLKEKRQAVISHAVTKGLDPDVPMRDSGVEWLGEVPAHWRVGKFQHFARVRGGLVDPRVAPYRAYDLVAPNHIESGTGKLLFLETAEEQGADSGKYICFKGDVIYSKIRPALAKVCISKNDRTLCSADMYPIYGVNGYKNKFLFWTLLSNWFTSLAELESDRVAMPKINREKLAEVTLAVPPLAEQETICAYLGEQVIHSDIVITKVEKALEMLKEKKSALISAAVTGKIDVRDWQPSSPEE